MLIPSSSINNRATRSMIIEGTRIKAIMQPLGEELKEIQTEMIGNLDELLWRLQKQKSGVAAATYFKV